MKKAIIIVSPNHILNAWYASGNKYQVEYTHN